MNDFHRIRQMANEGLDLPDSLLDNLLPSHLVALSDRHFTSCYIARLSAGYLAQKDNVRILDIGSGTGKFCLVGALYHSAQYVGVEYRVEYASIARELAKKLCLKDVSFLHANIVDIDFSSYDAFFMFNPFLEHRDASAVMDDAIQFEENDHKVYSEHVYNQFLHLKSGSLLATYCVPVEHIPANFQREKSLMGGQLVFWKSY